MAESKKYLIPAIDYVKTLSKKRMVYNRDTSNFIFYNAFRLLFILWVLAFLDVTYHAILSSELITSILALLSA